MAELRGAVSQVLVVESDGQTAAMAQGCLRRAGFAVEVSTSRRQAMRWVGRSWPDLVVLDARLPGEDGMAFPRLRAVTDVPVVMISPRGDEHERAWSLQQGADDFVPNPVWPDELVARVRGVLRRTRPSAGMVRPLTWSLLLDRATRRVKAGAAWVTLTSVEFRLLEFLARFPDQTFSRAELLEHVWGYTIGDVSTVTVHVRRLREKIEPDAAHPGFIVTVWGAGYRFDPSGGLDFGRQY